MIYEYSVTDALADGIIKMPIVYQPDIKTVQLTLSQSLGLTVRNTNGVKVAHEAARFADDWQGSQPAYSGHMRHSYHHPATLADMSAQDPWTSGAGATAVATTRCWPLKC